MKKAITALAAFAAVSSLLCSCSGGKSVLFGTGNLGGNYYTYGNAVSQFISADNPDISVNVKSTAGSAANLRLIQQSFLDLAIAQSDTLLDAYSGNGSFSEIPCSGVRAIAGLYIEECQLIVRADSDIYSVSDLYNRKVAVGEKESGVTKNAEQILFVNGLTFDNVDERYMSFSESAAALESGSIDAFFITADAPTTAVSELSKNLGIRVVPFSERTIERLIGEYPGYTKSVVPAGTYIGQNEDIETVGVKAVLVSGSKLSNDTAKKILDTIFAHSSELKYAAAAEEITLDFAASDIPVPFHSGAAEWYSSKGITVNTDNSGTTGKVTALGQD